MRVRPQARRASTAPRSCKHKRKVLGPARSCSTTSAASSARAASASWTRSPRSRSSACSAAATTSAIDVFPGAAARLNYSGNTVDICPVGALLNRDFRFQARVWFLSAAPTRLHRLRERLQHLRRLHAGRTPTATGPRENEPSTRAGCATRAGSPTSTLEPGAACRRHASAAARTAREADRAPRRSSRRREKLKPLAGTAGWRSLASPVASNEDLLAALRLRQGRAGRPARSTWAAGRRATATTSSMTRGQEPQPQGPGVDRQGLGLTLQPFAELLDGDRRRQGQGALRRRRRGARRTRDARARRSARLELLRRSRRSNESRAHRRRRTWCCPRRSHVEDEGTFVNLDGIIQRFRACLPARGRRRSRTGSGRSDSGAGVRVRRSAQTQRAGRVPRAGGPRVPELATLRLGQGGAAAQGRRRGSNPLPTGADGRPPGYREFGTAAGAGHLRAMRRAAPSVLIAHPAVILGAHLRPDAPSPICRRLAHGVLARRRRSGASRWPG